MDHPRLTDVAEYLLGDVLGLSEQAKSRPQPAPSGDDADGRADRDRRGGVPVPRRARTRRLSGRCWQAASTRSGRSPRTASTSTSSTTRIQMLRARSTPASADSSTASTDSIRSSSASHRARPSGSIRSSGSCSKPAWEGLERAGYSPAALRGSRTGVFVGVGANEYSHLLSADSVENIEPHFITGNALNAIAGRVAFALGLEGPAMAVDTACSSSLVAVHQACQALHSGDCDMALAGGVNVLLSPVTTVAASRARMLSPDGRCKTFDAAADGYVRSEGCGMLVLKRLSDAQRDGDRIRAVIRGSAVNQDGASSGLTVPNGGAQQRLISAALARAGLAGGDVDYLEAHGTGTPLGDPIEVQAAAAVYGGSRDPDRPLLMGSVKTNIGHLESAAGVAGLIKVVLSLQNELLPQSLHFQNPSPHIPWDSLPVRVVDKATPWHANGRPRRAGVSSFGFTGTNAHVLIEEAPAQPVAAEEVRRTDGDERRSRSRTPTSSRSTCCRCPRAHRRRCWRWRSDTGPGWTGHPDADLADVCFTAGAGRSHFEHRAALVVDSVPRPCRDGLAELAENRLRPGVVRGECTDRPTTAWLFTGQGSQYPGMARELFDAEPVFAETVTSLRRSGRRHAAAPAAGRGVRHRPGRRRNVAAHVVCPAGDFRRRDGPGPAVAVVGHRARRRARAQRRPVRSGVRGRGVQPRGRRAADGRARPDVRQPARRRPNGGGVRRRQARRAGRGRLPASVGRRLQRTPTRCCRVRRGSGADRRQVRRRRRSAAPGWRPATPSIRSCWIRCSTNSSRTPHSWSTPRRRCRWSATGPARC